MARLHRRSFLRLAGAAGAGSVLGVSAPAIVRAATAVKMTLPWLPLGTFSYAFVASAPARCVCLWTRVNTTSESSTLRS